MGPGAFCPPTETDMHDEAAYKDRLDITALEEGISALVDSRTRPIPSAALRRLAATSDRPATEPRPTDHAAMEEQPTSPNPAPAEPDYVNHPPHYLAHPSGVECI